MEGKDKKIEEAKATLAQQQAAQDEAERCARLKTEGSDYIIPKSFIVNADRMKGTEKMIEKLIRYGY
jgi:hypothetical protein